MDGFCVGLASCQHDNFFVSNFQLYPDRVNWRCRECPTNAVVYRPDKWIEEAMSGYMSIHREGQHKMENVGQLRKKSDDPQLSVDGSYINVAPAFLAKRPHFASRRYTVDEKFNFTPACGAFNAHAEQSVIFLEKRRVNSQS